MSGNLWEWVQDEQHRNYNGAPNDGSGWCTGNCPEHASDPNYDASNGAERVLRGGHWHHHISFHLNATIRTFLDPSSHRTDHGGRLAKSIRSTR